MIVILIAAAFVGGYLVGRGSAPQMSQAQRMAGRPPAEGGQPSSGQPGGNPGQRPTGQPNQQREQERNPEQSSQADQPAQGQEENPEQQPTAMTEDAPGGSTGALGSSESMTEEMRAAIAKAREEGKSREEIQAMIAKLRDQGKTEQPKPGVSEPSSSGTQSPAQPSLQGSIPDADTYTFYGTAAPSAEVNVQSKQGGTIIMLKGKEGDSVTKGEILVQFDDSEQQLNLDKARSSKNSTLQQVQQAETNLKAAQTNLERNQKLFKDGLISQQQIDDLQNKVEAAQVSLSSARENVSQADTQIALLEKGLENFVVRAPISGIIDKKNYNLQEIYRANDVLYHVVNIDDVYINVDVPETYIKQIREGVPVSVTFNALGEQRFAGTVETVLPSSTTANRTFTVKVRVKNPDHAIKPGMFASIQIALDE